MSQIIIKQSSSNTHWFDYKGCRVVVKQKANGAIGYVYAKNKISLNSGLLDSVKSVINVMIELINDNK